MMEIVGRLYNKYQWRDDHKDMSNIDMVLSLFDRYEKSLENRMNDLTDGKMFKKKPLSFSQLRGKFKA